MLDKTISSVPLEELDRDAAKWKQEQEQKSENLPPTWEAAARIFTAPEMVTENARKELIRMGQILDGVLEVFKNQHDESIKDSAEMVERQARGLEAIAKLLTASREEN